MGWRFAVTYIWCLLLGAGCWVLTTHYFFLPTANCQLSSFFLLLLLFHLCVTLCKPSCPSWLNLFSFTTKVKKGNSKVHKGNLDTAHDSLPYTLRLHIHCNGHVHSHRWQVEGTFYKCCRFKIQKISFFHSENTF